MILNIDFKKINHFSWSEGFKMLLNLPRETLSKNNECKIYKYIALFFLLSFKKGIHFDDDYNEFANEKISKLIKEYKSNDNIKKIISELKKVKEYKLTNKLIELMEKEDYHSLLNILIESNKLECIQKTIDSITKRKEDATA